MAKGKMPKGLKIALIVLGVLTVVGGGYMLYMKRKRDLEINGEITDGRMSSDLGSAPPVNAGVNSNAGTGGKKVTPNTTPIRDRITSDKTGIGSMLLGNPPMKKIAGRYKVHRVEPVEGGKVVITFHNRPAGGTIQKGDIVQISDAGELLNGRRPVTKVFTDANGKVGGVYVQVTPPTGVSPTAFISKLAAFVRSIKARPEILSNKAVVAHEEPSV